MERSLVCKLYYNNKVYKFSWSLLQYSIDLKGLSHEK
jgi:hypothetical protein